MLCVFSSSTTNDFSKAIIYHTKLGERREGVCYWFCTFILKVCFFVSVISFPALYFLVFFTFFLISLHHCITRGHLIKVKDRVREIALKPLDCFHFKSMVDKFQFFIYFYFLLLLLFPWASLKEISDTRKHSHCLLFIFSLWTRFSLTLDSSYGLNNLIIFKRPREH